VPILAKTVQDITCFLQDIQIETQQAETQQAETQPTDAAQIKGIQAENNGRNTGTRVTGICQDSRQAGPGFLFVCIRGQNMDGHDFAAKALQAGAGALLVERYLPYDVPQIKVEKVREVVGYLAAFLYGQPSQRLTMVGVTGTNGKTTVVSLVKHVAACAGHKAGVIGTLGAEVNNRLQPGNHTTPEAADVQRALDYMLDEGADLLAMEMSSHALHQGRLNGCAYDAVIFTNLSQDHLDYHSSMSAYLEAKALAFARGDFNKRGRVSILNGDDPACAYLKSKAASPVLTYGIDAGELDYRAKNIKMSDKGVGFEVVYEREGVTRTSDCLFVQTPGRFSVYNALAVFAWALACGYEEQAVRAALAAVRGVPGRFESLRWGQDFQVIVDYAHTPDGLINVLATAREITRGRLICVFGCGGDRDRTKRPLMGRAVCAWSDHVVVTSDNPRTEDPLAIIDDILPGLAGTVSYEVVPDRYKAIETACGRACTGDTVVIAGKGHEDYQIMGKEKIHFDDREVAAKVLQGLEKVRSL
jgi:UDP-N-acetylmuramoyl-L-alanyl-D-glutamate--2,6-diaminopimelate ligase